MSFRITESNDLFLRQYPSLTCVTPNELKHGVEDSEDDIDFELDADMMKLLNKNIKRMIKKSFEKSRKMSMGGTESSASSYNPLSVSSSSAKSSCSHRLSTASSVCSSQLVRKQDSPIVK